MLTMVVERAKWLRGEGSHTSYLLRHSDGKMCCLGFVCVTAGMTPEQISGLTAPASLVSVGRPIPAAVERLLDYNGTAVVVDSVITVSMMTTNDAEDVLGADREAQLQASGLEVGIQFTFV